MLRVCKVWAREGNLPNFNLTSLTVSVIMCIEKRKEVLQVIKCYIRKETWMLVRDKEYFLKSSCLQELCDENDAISKIEQFNVNDKKVNNTLWFDYTCFRKRRFVRSADCKKFYINDNDVIQKVTTYEQIPLRMSALSAFDIDMVMKYLKERGLECCPLKGKI